MVKKQFKRIAILFAAFMISLSVYNDRNENFVYAEPNVTENSVEKADDNTKSEESDAKKSQSKSKAKAKAKSKKKNKKNKKKNTKDKNKKKNTKDKSKKKDKSKRKDKDKNKNKNKDKNKNKNKDKNKNKNKDKDKKNDNTAKETKTDDVQNSTDNLTAYYPTVFNTPSIPNSTQQPQKPQQPQNTDKEKNNFGMKLLADYEAVDLMAVAKNSNNNLNSVEESVYKLFNTDNDRARLYFVELDSHILILDLNNRLKEFANAGMEQINPENKIYCLKNADSNVLEEADKDDLSKKDNKILLFSGNHRSDSLVTAEYMIGLPNNSYIGTMAAFDDTKEIAGINFKATEAELSHGANGALITLKSSTEAFDCMIDNNRFSFDEGDTKTAAYRGIGIFSLTGKLNIKRNIFEGKNKKNGTGSDNAHGMIDEQSRIKDKKLSSVLEIKENLFNNIYSAGTLLYASDVEAVHITNNVFNGTGEEAVKINPVSVAYPKKHDLIISNNKISRYGLNKNEGYTEGGAGPLGEVNSGESGIYLGYYDGVQCGSFVNNEWSSSSEQLSKRLQRDNLISTKAENDALDGVLDSSEVLIGQKGYYINTAEKINQNKYSTHNKSYVIVKDDNGNAVYGQDPDDVTAQIKIKDLYIVGKGSGVVTLPSTLYIKGNLKVDLPNGSIKVNARVDGTKEINSGLFKNSVTFEKVSSMPIPRGTAIDDFGIKISDVKNDKGEAIDSKGMDFSVILGRKTLEKSEYYYKDGVLYIKKEVINKLSHTEKLIIKASNKKKGLSEVSSDIIIVEISNLSKASFEYSTKTFSHMAAEQPITVKITDVKNNRGESIAAKDTVLKGNVEFRIFGQPQDKNLITVDDDKDTVTLSVDLLNYLYATKYTDRERNNNYATGGTYQIVINDEKNHIYEAFDEVNFEVIDRSGVDFVFENGMTYTQGEAPADGITLNIKNVVNTRGKSVSAADTQLKDGKGYLNMNVEPFPVQRDDTEYSEIIVERDKDGNYIREVINPRYVIIDDEKDTLTFTQEYLNRIIPGKHESTDRGIKTFTFKYTDTKAKVDVRSQKVALYIKFKEKKLSKDTGILFKDNSYSINGNKIVKNSAMETEPMAAGFLKWIIKQNPRQQLHILRDGNVLRGFDTIKKGDKLRVTAEDGETSVIYTLDFEVRAPRLSEVKFDKEIIKEITENAVVLNRGKDASFSIKKLLAALVLPESMTAKVVGFEADGREYEPVADATLTKEMQLILTKNGVSSRLEIRFSDGKQYRAILIGNQDYGSEKMNLQGPENDLRIMGSMFNRAKFDGQIFEKITVEKNLKKAEFLEKIRTAFKDATDEDISYIYYSGHGNHLKTTKQSYICTVDDIQNAQNDMELAANWVSTNELKAVLDKVNGTKVVILDCCNAGGFIGKAFEKAANEETFIKTVRDTFEEPNYFTTNDYKVLVASSENEYSYEDKKKAIGKFTEQFVRATTLAGDGYLLGDTDKNGEISIYEMYQHLMNTVESISHIQMFPQRDNFCLIKEMAQGELNSSRKIKVKNSAYEFKYNESANGTVSGMILSNRVTIDEKMSVKTFMSHIEKEYPQQTLSVVRVVNGQEMPYNENDMLRRAESYLKVVSERGDMVRYPILVKPYVSNEADKNIEIKGNPAQGINVTINKNADIYAISVNKSMTTIQFVTAIRNANRTLGAGYKIIGKNGNYKDLNRTTMLENLDKLEVTSKDGTVKKKYNITVIGSSTPGITINGEYTVENNVIKSGTKQLTAETKVAELILWINNNAQEIVKNADQLTGVYAAGQNPPFGRAKAATALLAKGDRFIVKDFITSKMTIYTIELAENIVVPTPPQNEEEPFAGLEPDFGAILKVENGEIKSGELKLTNQVKVEQLINAWKNKADFDKAGNSELIGIYKGSTNVFAGKPSIPARAMDETIGYEDKLLLIDKNGKHKSYKIVMADEGGSGTGPIIVVPPIVEP